MSWCVAACSDGSKTTARYAPATARQDKELEGLSTVWQQCDDDKHFDAVCYSCTPRKALKIRSELRILFKLLVVHVIDITTVDRPFEC